ncbi:MAG: glycosyltransferase family 4 protein [Promethearchaeota archaeon]
MKVCIISHFGYPLYNEDSSSQFGGGSEVQLYLLSKEFSKNVNVEVNVILGDFGGDNDQIEVIDKIKLYKILPLKRNFFNYFKFLFNFFFYLIKINPDIIIQRAISVTTGLTAAYCMIFRKKFIYSIANKPDVDSSKNGLIYKIFRFGLKHADYVIAQNHEQMDLLKKLKIKNPAHALVLKSGYPLRKSGIDISSKSDILWVGRAVNWKRPELFIKLALMFKNHNFKMICTKYVDQEYWEDIKKLTENIPNLKFIEYVKFSEIENYFKKAKVYINTSVYEGFPNTFLQAFKYETPVISLNVNPNNIFDDYNIGYYCNDNFDLLKEKLSELMQNSTLQETIGRNAYSHVSKFHDIEIIGKQWIKVINFMAKTKNKE